MMEFATLKTENLRLVVVKALAEDAGYEHNETVLHSIVDQFGHNISRDRLRTELAWLAEQGLIALRDVAGYQVARLTGRGVDVAEGNVIVPGVQRPRPRG